MLAMALIFGGISVVSAATRRATITVDYGFNVYVDGIRFEPRDRHGIIESFNHNGWIWAPFEHIAVALGKDAHWEAATNSLFLGRRTPVGTRVPLREAAPFFDRNPNADSTQGTGIWFDDTVTMGGTTYNNPLNFRRSITSGATQFTLHNLHGEFRTLSGYMGRVDGTRMENVTVRILGDGRVLQTYELRATDMPISFSVSVMGVQQLRIEIIFPANSNRFTVAGSTRYAVVAFLE